MTDPFDPNGGSPPRGILHEPSGTFLDKTDFKILGLLAMGARESIQSLAEKIHMSHSGTVARIRRLEESGVILRYYAEIDETLFEDWPSYSVYLQLSLRGRRYFSRVADALQNAPEVREAYEIFGEYDLSLRVSLRSPRDWHFLRARLDPRSNLFARTSHPIQFGEVRKPLSPHPLLLPGTD